VLVFSTIQPSKTEKMSIIKQGIMTDLQPPLIPPGNLFSLIMEKQYDHWKTAVKCKQPSTVVVVFVLKKKKS